MSYKYSVIIPVYNASSTLRRCLDSLVGQTLGRAELILINDGSKDESLRICCEYENRYVEVKVIDQQNAGAAAARNAGLDAAEGTYISFVDSDDYVPDNYFDILDQAEDSDFAIYSYVRVVGDNRIPVIIPPSIIDPINHVDRVIRVVENRFASPWNKRYKRSIIEENTIRFKKDLIIGEDFLFGLTYMLCCHSSFACNDSIYFVDESSSVSVTRSAKYKPTQYAKIYEYAFPTVEQCSWDDKDRKRLLQQLDYLFCRTSFVAATHLQKTGSGEYSLKELLQGFYDQSRWAVQPLNATHALMKRCIKNKALLVYRAISFIHNRRGSK